ncbi:hypothetical protein DLAC_08767 [Tieghemostelium lacteum]|uniref:MRH domain-containing protein n=1 Tax=Tieghemostelium lacteum TaxID=361077 RepID=A0A151Z8N6_TIELA|nr:hypothetical protein DLAC_08767 [Tieghemostelium lacteum]|eukprot:KYQ90174.1 hypothetical protein DLAC_08767 [Tieghemostelium lacteum]
MMDKLLFFILSLLIGYLKSQPLPNCEFIDYYGRYYDFSPMEQSVGYEVTLNDLTYIVSVCNTNSYCEMVTGVQGTASCGSENEGKYINMGQYSTMTLGDLPYLVGNPSLQGAQLNYTTNSGCFNGKKGTMTTQINLVCQPGQDNLITSSGLYDECLAYMTLEGDGPCPFQNVSSSSDNSNQFECHFLGDSVAVVYPNQQITCTGQGKTVCSYSSDNDGNLSTCASNSDILCQTQGEIQCFGENLVCSHNSFSCGFQNGKPFYPNQN